MKLYSLFLLIFFMGLPLHAQKSFKDGQRLNDKGEYKQAARIFASIQQDALDAGDINLYMDCLFAEGEACYMLDRSSEMKQIVDKANEVFYSKFWEVSDSVSYSWWESLRKLEGSYYYTIMDVDSSAYLYAEEAYEDCFKAIAKLKEISFCDDAQMTVIVQRELLSLYYKKQQYEKALPIADKICSFYDDGNGTERQFIDAHSSRAMILARLNRFEEALNDLNQCEQTPDVLRKKGKILMMQFDYDGTDRVSNAIGCYEQYVDYMKKQSSSELKGMTESQREQHWLAMHNFLYDCCRLGNRAPEMIYDLALYSKGFLLEYTGKKNKHYTWKDVKRHLPDNACAIEFIQYFGKNERKQLGALVITKNANRPLFLQIADVEELSNQYLSGRVSLGDALRSAYANHKNAIYNDPYLPMQIWTEELMKATDNAKIIYFSPDGIIQQLAIEYLMPDTTRSCRRLTTTRNIIKGKQKIDYSKMLLCGAIEYSANIHPSMTGNDDVAYSLMKTSAPSLVYLPATEAEIDSIIAIRDVKDDCALRQAEATDETFRKVANNYPLIHVATHGFFIGDAEIGTDLKPLLCDNSMSQSGLVFSGARKALENPIYNKTLSDGILSAKEISEIPLDHVDLMVLSACQTGLGFITADGVYGVQRALKQAGVKAMIVSLWSVYDLATSKLMRYFYKNLQTQNEGDIYDAFTKARRQLKTEKEIYFSPSSLQYKIGCLYDEPKYVDAFILIDVL